MNSARMRALEPGAVIDGKYRVERVLGEGGMGIVVAAMHLQLEQRVAIKALLPEALENTQSVERFAREARVSAKIASEHVARVFDVGTLPDGSPYMVMEYLEGKDLKQLVKAEGPLPVGDACEFLLQACEALAEAHAAGIIHRDLKPANIFVTRRADGSPNVKLLDFGISKLTVHTADPSITSTSLVMGSPGYMSPEQMKSTRDVDARADIWALGTVLYEVLTGRPAFVAETMPQLCALILSEYPPLPSSLRDDLPIALERAILRCLEKQPEARFGSVGELAQALAEHAHERAQTSLRRIGASLGDASLPAISARSPAMAAVSTTDTSRVVERPARRGGCGVVLALLVAAAAVVAWRARVDWSAARQIVMSSVGAASSQATPPTVAASAAPSATPVASATASAPSASASASAAPPVAADAPDAATALALDASAVDDAAAVSDDDDGGDDDDAGVESDAGAAPKLAPSAPKATPPPNVAHSPRVPPRRHPPKPQRPHRKPPPRK